MHIKSQSIDDVTNVDECSSVSSLVVARFWLRVSLYLSLFLLWPHGIKLFFWSSLLCLLSCLGRHT